MFSWFPGNSLDILINNAGVWGQTPLGSTSEETLDAMVDVNLKGIFRVTQHALPKLKDGASIVNISSTAARVGNKSGRSLYGATKAAVDALTRSWALELAPRKIRVNAVAPGYVETDMTSEFFSNRKIREDAVERSPFGRLGNADEIADVVLFLCSPAAGWITGQAINVSGGFVVCGKRPVGLCATGQPGGGCPDARPGEINVPPPWQRHSHHPGRVRPCRGEHRAGSFHR
jgi:NAD(P)-dependent dehydrogenase (short-subunit alcohol dehydrogenase family)